MKHLLTIDSFDSLWRSISQISQVVACSLVLLSLISCGSGGSGSERDLCRTSDAIACTRLLFFIEAGSRTRRSIATNLLESSPDSAIWPKPSNPCCNSE